jgi:plastocyanin
MELHMAPVRALIAPAFRPGYWLLPLLLVAAACGVRDDARNGDAEQVHVRMGEYFFESSQLEFVAGRTYRFVLVNEGAEPHEWAVVPHGDEDESRLLTEVEEEDLPPGATVTHTFTFPQAGTYDFACFLPGHYEAGMVLPVTVVAPE